MGASARRLGATQQTRSCLRGNGFGGNKLATAYSCVTFRQATIGFAAFHFRVRDGNGWAHCGISPEIYSGRFACAVCAARLAGLTRVLMMDCWVLGCRGLAARDGFDLKRAFANGSGGNCPGRDDQGGPGCCLKAAHKRLTICKIQGYELD